MKKSVRNRSISSSTETDFLLLNSVDHLIQPDDHTACQTDNSHDKILSEWKDYKQFSFIPTTTVDQMPSWYVSDSYLLTGYRRITNSFQGCILSLQYLHNESVNVYSHMIGSILLFPLGSYILWNMSHYQSYYMTDSFLILIYLLGLLACLSLSTTFHLFNCHSRNVSKFTNKADYVGIVCLQLGSFIPLLYYGFYCDFVVKSLYMVVIGVLGLGAVVVTVGPSYAAVEYRWLRTALFGGFGGIGVFPAIHHVWRYFKSISYCTIYCPIS
jgi:adiponectin receptor